jgi:glutamate---cysteine ligase / carboxylate-amine ligase
LTQALVATLGEAFDRGEAMPVEPALLVSENKWRAARYGLNTNLIDFSNDTERPAADAVRALVERCEPAARELGCTKELAAVESLLARGTGADEQTRLYEETQSLLAVAQWIAQESVREL